VGILDTGSDFTTIPSWIATALRLRQISQRKMTNADGSESWAPVYVANMEFGGFSFDAVAMLGTGVPIILVGRDVLNELASEFNGPALTFSLSRP
jgi:predicted aspartyl protease